MKLKRSLLFLAVFSMLFALLANTSNAAGFWNIEFYSDFSPTWGSVIKIDGEELIKPLEVQYWHECEIGKSEICFGDYYKLLPKNASPNRFIVPDTIVLHTDDQSGNTPKTWFTKTTYNGLSGGKLSVHFAVGLDGIGQFLAMYPEGVMQCRGAGWACNCHSIQIEMAGRTYNYMFNGKASPEMEESIKIITDQTLELVVALMITYDIPIENVIGHYQVKYSGKTDPGDVWLQEYFLPLLQERLDELEN